MGKLTLEEVQRRLKEVNVSMIDEYINAKSMMKMCCDLCELDFIMTFTRALKNGHTNCQAKGYKTDELKLEEIRQFAELHGETLLTEEYPSSKGKLDVQCGVCGEKYLKNLSAFRTNPRHSTCTMLTNAIGHVLSLGNANCEECSEKFKVKEQGLKYCSQECMHKSRCVHEMKECDNCGNMFRMAINKIRFCNKICYQQYLHTDEGHKEWAGYGAKSAASQLRRSKNEVYMHDLCVEHFGLENEILSNIPMFLDDRGNGWDADIIIPHLKIAILWNGAWHYLLISKTLSLAQVLARDKIKMDVIRRCGYTPYVVKDMGKYDVPFVEEQFNLFLQYIKDRGIT